MLSGSSAPVEQRAKSERTMKKASGRSRRNASHGAPRIDGDEIMPEYDFSAGKRNRFAARVAGHPPVVQLDEDVAATFPDSESVNSALRALAGIIQQHAPSTTAANLTRGSAAS